LSKPQSFWTNLQNPNTSPDIISVHTNIAVYTGSEVKLPESPPNIIAKSLKTFLKNIYSSANIVETKNIVTNISFIATNMKLYNS
jgi:hypothetical protein